MWVIFVSSEFKFIPNYGNYVPAKISRVIVQSFVKDL